MPVLCAIIFSFMACYPVRGSPYLALLRDWCCLWGIPTVMFVVWDVVDDLVFRKESELFRWSYRHLVFWLLRIIFQIRAVPDCITRYIWTCVIMVIVAHALAVHQLNPRVEPHTWGLIYFAVSFLSLILWVACMALPADRSAIDFKLGFESQLYYCSFGYI